MEQMQPLRFGTMEQYDDPSDKALEDALNRTPGKQNFDKSGNPLPSELVYDCPICLNRGFMWRIHDGERYTERCKCMNTRVGLVRLQKSGLAAAAKRCTFSNFKVEEDFQQVMLDTAKRFLVDRDRKWMFIAGQTGCGKTHICTATTVKILKAGAITRYVPWLETKRKLGAALFDEDGYEELIKPLKNAKCLYIDDLFKTQGNKPVSDREYQLAMELLNARYNNPGLITIISTEHTLNALQDMDAALAGRIAERSKGYRVQIAKKAGRNYRERFLGDEV